MYVLESQLTFDIDIFTFEILKQTLQNFKNIIPSDWTIFNLSLCIQ